MKLRPDTRSRADIVTRLRAALPERNLYDLAAGYGIATHPGGKLNKGWVGQTIERVAGLGISNAQRRDGYDFELKSTSLVPDPEVQWRPKETIKVTQLTPTHLLEEEFETSALWDKLSRLILVGVHHDSESSCRVVRVATVDIEEPDLVGDIRGFWEDVRHLLAAGELPDYPYLGSAADHIQLRPTGNGRQRSTCPITGRLFPAQAFYATKQLIARVLEL